MASKTLTKEELAKRLRDAHGGISLDEATGLVDTILAVLEEGLVRDGQVKIRGFGTFQLKKRKARVSKHPATGLEVRVPEAVMVSFRQSKGLLSQ